MSKPPFDPMRTVAPPPPPIDTVGVDARDYITVVAAGGDHTFVAHRDCLCMAQLIRRAFAKRADVQLDDVVISFTSGVSVPGGGDDAEDNDDVNTKADVPSSPVLTEHEADSEAQHSDAEGNEVEESADKAGGTASPVEEASAAPSHKSSITDSTARSGRGAGVTFVENAPVADDIETRSTRSDCTASSPERGRAPGQLKEVYRAEDKLRNNRSVTISFPRSSHEIVDTVLAYLYYKHRYNGGSAARGRPQPVRVLPHLAVAVMKLANILEC